MVVQPFLGIIRKLSTCTERWFECECIHIWAIGCTAYESCLKIQCPQEPAKKLLRLIFSDVVYSTTYTVVK